MNRFNRYILTLSLAAAVGSVNSQGQTIDPVTQAALDSYAQLLKENPGDYMTLYQRAAQYYMMKRYDEALADLHSALKVTPAKDVEMKAGEYSLISDIYSEKKDYKEALSAIDSALALQGSDYLMLFRKANLCLKVNKPEEAYKNFSRMQAINSRSQDAYFGMAQADLMMNRKEDALLLIQQGESLGATNYITYCKIGNLYKGAGDDYDAGINYLKAFSMQPDKPEPIQQLAQLASSNYRSLEMAFNNCISKSTNPSEMYYLLGRLSLASGHYRQADNCYTLLMEEMESPTPAILAGAAEACYYRDKQKEAAVYINNALSKEQRAEYYIVKANIENASDNTQAAIASAQAALKLNPADNKARMALAISYIMQRNGESAINNLNDIIAENPSDIRALMLRAYVNFELLDNAKASVADYVRISRMDPEDSFRGNCMKALAMALSGQLQEGNQLMKDLLKDDKHKTADAYYDAAVYYSQTGNLEEGIKMARKAIEMGYENLFELYTDKTANLTISPIRHLLK